MVTFRPRHVRPLTGARNLPDPPDSTAARRSHVVALIGAEFENNLSIRYLAAAAEASGFAVALLPFNGSDWTDAVVDEVVRLDPLVVGISVPFQLLAHETLSLAGRMRARGVSAHITVGGHFATFEYANILRDHPALDSVVRHEGEATFTELCRRVRDGASVAGMPGTIVSTADGIVEGAKHPLPSLDELRFPDRRGTPNNALGVRSTPIVGSRGCYADCSFCCIYAWADNADGARYRRRSPENIVREMAEEYRHRGVRLFVFHDDNFFVPSQSKNLERYARLHELLVAEGMDDIGLVIKCRPNDVTHELFALLKSMGMVRAYVGIETNSDEGVVSLNRKITPEDNRRAMQVLSDLDVYSTFNILIFDPEATLEGVRRNLAFMEEFADTPFNFCRAEVYAGTPLKAMLERDGRLQGNYLAWSYEMRDPAVELLFRVVTTAFRTRNFKSDGVANLNMGIRFDDEVTRRFYPECWDVAWHAELRDLSRRIGLDSVALFREALAFIESGATDPRTVKAFATDMARRVSEHDLAFVKEIKARRRALEARILRARGATRDPPTSEGPPVWAAETDRLGASTGSYLATEVLPEPSEWRTLSA